MIKSNAKQFMKEISIELDNFERDAENVIKEAVLITHGTVTTLSPVDTGRYKASHFISKGQESDKVVSDGADYGGETEKRKKEAESVKPKLESISWYVTNNLEYSEALEGGHSQQAPNGVYAPAHIIARQAINRIVSIKNAKRIR